MGDIDPSAVPPSCADVLREADALLALPGDLQPASVALRLRLARDELTTKVLKARATEEAERCVNQELSRARDRLVDEIEAARHATSGTRSRSPGRRH